jgi:uncharacterized protein (DUF433 family)
VNRKLRTNAGQQIQDSLHTSKAALSVSALPFVSNAVVAFRHLFMKTEELIERNPEKMSGTPVFPGTRVPIKHLFDYLEGGDSLEEFLDQFPTVSREQAVAVLTASRNSILNTPPNTQARTELMSQAANDELFMADLNATMDDFKDADSLEPPNLRIQRFLH